MSHDEVSYTERTHCFNEVMAKLLESLQATLVLMNEPLPISRATYIAQLRVITQAINRAHSRALNYQNVACIAEIQARPGVKQ